MSVDSTNAKWDSPEEIRSMMDYLREHHSGAGDGANYTETIFRAAAVHIRPLLKTLPVKTGGMVRNKYKGVCVLSDRITH